MKKTENRGFTLIELLVVIAIIGILAAVVLTSLSSARNAAKDASAQSSMTSIRATAEIYYTKNGEYDGVCSDDEIEKLLAAASAQTGNGNQCVAGSKRWRAHVQLTDSSRRFCVDSTGFAGEISGPPPSRTMCDLTTSVD